MEFMLPDQGRPGGGKSAAAAGDRVPAVVHIRRGKGSAASGTFELLKAGGHRGRLAACPQATTEDGKPPIPF